MVDTRVRAHACHVVSSSDSNQPVLLADTLVRWTTTRCKCTFRIQGERMGANISVCSVPGRIAGWAGNVLFDGVVTGLTLFRAIRLRGTGARVTLAERMGRDGIYYFGKHVP